MSAARRCEECGTPLVRRENEAANKFRQRRFCDRLCANRFVQPRLGLQIRGRSEAMPRFCAYCGKVLRRGLSEGRGDFKARRFCGHRCHRLSQARFESAKVGRALLAYWRIECGFVAGVPFRYGYHWGVPLPGFEGVSQGTVRHAVLFLIERGVVRLLSAGRGGGGRGKAFPSEYVLLKTRL